MDYERGLDLAKQYAKGTDWYREFSIFEGRLRENLRVEDLYGGNEQTRSDRARIVDQLNQLVYPKIGISFNDLCRGM